jgi:putative spermidine/putrescine transport system permease protein
VIFVPTAYWVRLRLPRVRPIVEFVTLLPFVVPAIVLVYGLVATFSRPPLPIVNSPLLLIFGYTIMSMPYMYRAVDTGLRAVDVPVLTEAAQSLGAGWATILLRVVFPNIRTAVLSGSFLTFAIVMGEYTLAQWLAKPAFGPYMNLLGQVKAYEPAACAIISFALTWAAMGIMQFVGRGAPAGAQVAGAH